jgi:hypothetical protein
MSGLGAARDPATPEKVWIVERSDGQYEEYREKIIAVYLDEGMANEHAKKADEWHTKWVTEPRHNIDWDEPDALDQSRHIQSIAERNPYDWGSDSADHRSYYVYPEDVSDRLPVASVPL